MGSTTPCGPPRRPTSSPRGTRRRPWRSRRGARPRSAKLSGILNGIDYDVWNPAKDELIAQRYSKATGEKKARSKAALQEEAGLPTDPKAPPLGIVSRVTQQKGFDILIPALPQIAKLGAQVVLLGTGEKKYEEPLFLISKEI